MEPDHHIKPPDKHTNGAKHEATRTEDPTGIKPSAWIGTGVAILIMVPAVYRLSTEPPAWADIVFVSIGVALIIFHSIRVIRLYRK